MAALVTLPEAKAHLRIMHDDEDATITLMMNAATEIVVDYIKRPDHEWTDADAPFLIKAAVLLVLTGLYENRGDEESPDYSQADGYLAKTVTAILHRYRDPAFA